MAKVVPININQIDPNAVLESALTEYSHVFVIGYDHNGEISARGSSNLTRSDILWLIEAFKIHTLFWSEDDET